MDLRSYPEFSLGEFATSEFSRDSAAFAHYASLEATARSEAHFVSNRYVLAGVYTNGLSHSDLKANSYANVRSLEVGGLAGFEGKAQSVKSGTALLRNTSSVKSAGGYATLALFDISSGSFVEFTTHSDLIYSLEGSATVLVNSEATRNIDLVIENPSSVSAFGQIVLEAAFHSKGLAQSRPQGSSINNGRFVARHRSVSRQVGQTLSHSSFDTHANGSAFWGAVRVLPSHFDVDASAGIDVLSHYLRYLYGEYGLEGNGQFHPDVGFTHYIATAFTVHGESGLWVPANAVGNASYSVSGDSNVEFIRGSHVFLSLPIAFDVVERPYENRTVLRYTNLDGRSR